MSPAALRKPMPQTASPADLAAALGEAETKLRDFLDVSSDWVWETDAELRFTYFSGRLQERSGADPSVLLGRTRREVMTNPEAAHNRLHLADLAAHRTFRDFLYETETTAGKRWFKVSGKPVRAPDGTFRGYRGTGSDVTAEHEARRRADELHARFVDAIESIPASLILCAGDDRIVIFNSITLRFFPRVTHLLKPGLPFADLLRGQAESGFVPAAVGRVEEWLAERLAQHRNPTGTITRLYGDGRWVQIVERRTADGGTIGLRFDVTDIKRQEAELATKTALLEATLDNISQGISVVDAELRVAAFNKRFLELLNFPESLGRPGTPFADLIRYNAERGEYGPGDVEAQVAQRLELAKNPVAHRFERARPDGTIVEIVGKPMPGGGFVTTYADVTEHRGAQKLLAEHARELERSNAELEQFAYVASHDLQEPLRMVASYCQLLQRRYKGKLDGDADEFIGFAVEGATRMQRMINELLNYSRVGRRSAEFAEVDAREVVEGALDALRAAIDESGAEVRIGSLPTLRGDRTLLHQLFQNLVGNGLKFRGERPPAIRIDARREEDAFLFSIADNGIGIEGEYLEKIFLLFQRLHERAKYPGTGIGLAVCKKVAEHHGGRIWVESVPGEGSTFFFTISDAARTQ